MDSELARQMIEQYGYLAVFISTILEGEFVVIAAAAIASSGLMEAHWVIVAAALGALVGHLLLFAIGRWKGFDLIMRSSKLRKLYPAANLIMDKYANYSVFVFQYLYGMRLISALLFGCSTISFYRFLFLETINCIIWALFAYFLGHFIGILAMKIFEALGVYGLIGVTAGVAGAAVFLYHRFAHSHVKALLSSGRILGKEQLDPAEGRHFVLEQLAYHIELAKRSGQPLALLLLRLSHPRAKTLLRSLTKELCAFLRVTDIPTRFSKDAVAIVVPNTSLEGAKKMIHRFLERVTNVGEADEFLHDLAIGMTEWTPSLSAGKMLDNGYAALVPVSELAFAPLAES